MIIRAENLTKLYAGVAAVDGLSFEVDSGEIVGLLGPNGAGKTTTMRMLTCFIPPSNGTAAIAGHDVLEEPLAVRRHIGYMPESNPLYGEMRIGEYLSFRAKLKGVPRRERASNIGWCVERCSLQDVRQQVIRTLSKGYRQRVGLADAMLGDPPLLILDEPTIGLDPNQIRQTRRMIRELGEHRTILISTHILQEVEAICQRMLIIDRGRILADDTPASLSGQLHGNAVELEVAAPAETAAAAFAEVEGAAEAKVLTVEEGWTRLMIPPVDPTTDLREPLFQKAVARGWTLRELVRRRVSLEDVFERVTLGAESGETEQ